MLSRASLKAEQILGTAGTGTGILSLFSGASATMTLDASSRVGIGTSSPLSSLHVKGPVDDTPNDTGFHFGMSADDTAWAAQKISSTTGAVIDFQDGTGSSQHSGRISYTHADDTLKIRTNATARLTCGWKWAHIGINTEKSIKCVACYGVIQQNAFNARHSY